jgi:hypothetical protein
MAKNNSPKSSSLSGWQGRSGLDPVDTSRINASVDGIFLKRLFTLRLRTRNFFSLMAMLMFGVAATGLMTFAIYAMMITPLYGKPNIEANIALAVFYCLNGFVLLVGIALLLNFFINLGIILGFVRTQSKSRSEGNSKEFKKKPPKRRKDYR